MPVSSYLGIPKPGFHPDEILRAVQGWPYIEVEYSEDKECLLILLDTPDKASDEELRNRLETLPMLAGLSLVFAADTEFEETL